MKKLLAIIIGLLVMPLSSIYAAPLWSVTVTNNNKDNVPMACQASDKGIKRGYCDIECSIANGYAASKGGKALLSFPVKLRQCTRSCYLSLSNIEVQCGTPNGKDAASMKKVPNGSTLVWSKGKLKQK